MPKCWQKWYVFYLIRYVLSLKAKRFIDKIKVSCKFCKLNSFSFIYLFNYSFILIHLFSCLWSLNIYISNFAISLHCIDSNEYWTEFSVWRRQEMLFFLENEHLWYMLLSLRVAGENCILNTINKKSSLFLVRFEEVQPFFLWNWFTVLRKPLSVSS